MFEIVTYGGGGFFTEIFNGIAMIFGNNDYIFALKMCATLAAMGIVISCAFTGRYPDLKWLIIMICIYNFAFLPKVTLTITDTVERTPGFFVGTSTPTVRTVANVPIGLAFVASFGSGIRDWLVRTNETVFALPNEVSFRRGGNLFAQGISESAVKAKPKDPNLSMSLSNFWKDCVFYDMALGFYSMGTLAKQDKLQEFLAANTAAGRAFEFTASDGTKTFETCRAAISTGGKLQVALDKEVKEQSQIITFINNYSTKPNASNALITSTASAMPVAFTYLTGMSYTSSELLAQTTLANSFQDGLVAFSNSAEASSVMQGYAAAKAESERNITFSVMGKVAGKMLPLLAILVEGLIYCLAPVVGMMLMFPQAGKVAMGYIMAILWVALWAPLYALLHFFQMYFGSISATGAAQVCDAANVCAAHLNMYTMTGLKESFSSAAAIAGYLSTMVPMIAWMVISRSGAMMAGAVGRVMDGYQQPVSHAATEAAGGNIQMGNMSYQNLQAWQQNTAPSQTGGFAKNDTGDFSTSSTATGNITERRMSSLGIDGRISEQATVAAKESLSQATQKVEQTSASLSEANVAAFRNTMNYASGGSHSKSGGNGVTSSEQWAKTTATQEVSQAFDKWAKNAGIDSSEKGSVMGGLGLSTPIVKAGVSTEGSASAHRSNEIMKAFSESKEFSEATNNIASAAKDKFGREQWSADQKSERQMSSSLDNQKKAEEAHSVAVQEQVAAQKTLEGVQSHSSEFSRNLSNELQKSFERQNIDYKKGLSDLDSPSTSNSAEAVAVKEAIQRFVESHTVTGGPSYADEARDISAHGREGIRALSDESNSGVVVAKGENDSHVPAPGFERKANAAYAGASTEAGSKQSEVESASVENKDKVETQGGNTAADVNTRAEQGLTTPGGGKSFNLDRQELNDPASIPQRPASEVIGYNGDIPVVREPEDKK